MRAFDICQVLCAKMETEHGDGKVGNYRNTGY